MADIAPWTDPPSLAQAFKTYLDEINVETSDADALDWAECYIEDVDRWAWQILSDGRVAGFALVRESEEGGMDFSEFWVAPSFRGAGLGAVAAHTVLARYRGPWVLGALPRPLSFWRRTLASCPGLTNLAEGPSPLGHQAALFRFTIEDPT